MFGIGQEFRLRGIALAPPPLIFQVFREGEGIFQTADINSRPGIAVPEPGAANAAARLINPCGQPEAPGAVQHVHAGKPRPDDD